MKCLSDWIILDKRKEKGLIFQAFADNTRMILDLLLVEAAGVEPAVLCPAASGCGATLKGHFTDITVRGGKVSSLWCIHLERPL